MARTSQVARAAAQHRSDGGPVTDEYKLREEGSSVITTLMKRAFRAEGIDPDTDDLDTVTQFYYPDEGVIAIPIRELVDDE